MRRLIIDAARQILVDEGVDAVSIRRIADRIEYSPGTIYLYFEDKDDILYEIHLEAFQAFYQAELPVLNIPDPLERLRALGRAYIAFALENPRTYEIMFLIPVPRIQKKDKYDWSVSVRTFEVLRTIVAECIEKGLITPGHPDIAALTVWSTVHGIASLLIRERIPMIDKTADDIIPPFLEYMFRSKTQ